jgi:sigma-B regulation protein RsbU (phosphoserine phosphatase)
MENPRAQDHNRSSASAKIELWLNWGSQIFGSGFLRLQLVLILLSLTVWTFLRILGAHTSLAANLVFTFCVGNWSSILVYRSQSLFTRRAAPWNWLVFLAIIVAVGLSGSLLADAVLLLVFPHGGGSFFQRVVADAPVGTFVTLIFGVVSFRFEEQRSRMEERQQELQGQVQLGRIKEESHQTEMEQAHEIQRHLLPRDTPQIAGFQIACAWQPAKSVSGDYFDVLQLGEGRLGLCIADVSGKGITAALLMANLQASVKAFAPEAPSPAVLCAKLNSVLCDTVAPGKFVTLFYGIIDTKQREFHYENAGHCLPLLVRGDGSILLPASYSGVLGLFSHWTYQDSELQLQPGDCLVLMTDGVLEAANRDEEEFGYQRLIDVVKKNRGSGVHGIRTAILEAVSAFCNGKFDDDASLIVVTVD